MDKIEGKPYVKNKDGDETNNHVNNLEWMSLTELLSTNIIFPIFYYQKSFV